MTKIKISPENSIKIQAAIDTTEGKATRRTLSAEHVSAQVEQMERTLESLGVPKKCRAGVTLEINGSERLAKSYGATATATYVTAVRGSSAWYMTDVTRSYNQARATQRFTHQFTDSQIASWALAAKGLTGSKEAA